MTDPTDWSTRRSDARRNHERVLSAAIEVFTERGIDASMADVAARAGVGKATVFRSYPTKADLVRAIAQRHVDWLVEAVGEVARRAEVDAHAALRDGLAAIMMRLAQDRLMVDVLRGAGELGSDELARGIDRVLDEGRRQGVLRGDVTGLDIQVLVTGAARALLDLDIRDPEIWRRYAHLSLAALLPQATGAPAVAPRTG